MSIPILNWAWNAECKSAAQKLVLISLADHADLDGQCFPGNAQLSERCGLSQGMIRRHLDALEEQGYLTRTRRRRPDGTLGTYRYIIGDQRASSTSGTQCTDQRAPATAPARIYSRALTTIESPSNHSDKSETKTRRRTQVPDYETLRALMSEKETGRWTQTFGQGKGSREQLEQFHDYHAARATQMADWRAALRTWCRNGFGAKPSDETTGDPFLDWQREQTRLERLEP